METGAIIIISIVGIIFLGLIVLFVMWIISKMKGKITVEPEKIEYQKGEEASGKITLKLKKPLEADALNIGLAGYQRTRSYSRRGARTSTNDKIFDFKKPISGKKMYPAGESTYEFKLQIPTDITSKLSTGNKVTDSLLSSAQAISGMGTNIRWYLYSDLEISGINIRGKRQINIA